MAVAPRILFYGNVFVHTMAYIAPILNIAVWPVLDIWRAGKFLRFKRSEAVLTVWTTGFPCGYRAGQSNCRSAGSVLYDGFAGIDFQESPRFGGGNFSRADSKNPPHSGGLRFARALKSALGTRKKRAPCSSVFCRVKRRARFLNFCGKLRKAVPPVGYSAISILASNALISISTRFAMSEAAASSRPLFSSSV